ncbi:MAG: hypothetical protein WAV52_02835 [Luteococcus japonicus]
MAKKQRSLRFEMPFAMTDPVLVNPEVGITHASRRGSKHSFTTDTTLLDSPDHRLLRAGIVLAHRVTNGLGEWYLDAPGWGPWLPSDRAEPLGAAGDLPEEFASLVRPFRRSAALGPVAAINNRRVEWNLLGTDGVTLARVRDEQLELRRGGLVTARFREITVLPRQEMARPQIDHVVEALLASGGAQVERFPVLVERIGAPATGLTDFRGPLTRGDDMSLEGFVSWLFARRLDAVMRADLTLRSGQSDDMDLLRHELAEYRGEVRSLAFALEPAWRELLEHELDLVLNGLASRTVHQLGDEYFDVLDSLVMGARAPKLGNLSQQRALTVLRQQATSVASILFDRARSLTMTSHEDRWQGTLAAAQQMTTLAHTNRVLFGKQAKRLEESLGEVVEQLRLAQMPPGVGEPSVDLEWDPVTAFQEGRRYERRRQECTTARRAFIEQWSEHERRMRKVQQKAEKLADERRRGKGSKR